MKRLALVCVVLATLLPACQTEEGDKPGVDRAETRSVETVTDSRYPAAKVIRSPDLHDSVRERIRLRAGEILEAMERGAWEEVAMHVHPEYGLGFSPYAYIDTAVQVRFSQAEVGGVPNDTTTRHWGLDDPGGLPIVGTFREYAASRVRGDRYVDLASASSGCSGSTHGNVLELYGDSVVVVAWCYPGTEELQGLDWSRLSLVFRPTADRWYLTDVVNDERTH